ncbi:MAG: UDP-2,4-diacetamido-2,4,6-trideoxy-beta-L-altropyranose hydrolase [Deltaproteobacteria bacterium]|nr:UDP-2,4-diacetamido-2,4,6-trideoxy-beta-L-altropyranose hydrolase [Deltaproteobacteria bacterium]
MEKNINCIHRIVIRTDANARMGTGHLMRCLALAQAWQDAGGHAAFLTIPFSSILEDRLKSEGMDIVYLSAGFGSSDDALQTAALAKEIDASWIVLDGYQFDGTYQQALKSNGRKLLFLDDYGHVRHYCADLVLNQNLYADKGLYANREPYTQILLGAEYVLLGRHFEKWRGWRREIPEVARNVLVTLGGSDPDNVTFGVIEALEQLDGIALEVRVVVGPANPHFQMLRKVAERSTLAIQIFTAVTDMPALMAWADIAISAGGSTCWEIAYMGLPNCTIVIADNQLQVAEILQELGVSTHMGRFDSIDQTDMIQVIRGLVQDKKHRRSMSIQGQSVIPGFGSQNVVRAMLEHKTK